MKNRDKKFMLLLEIQKFKCVLKCDDCPSDHCLVDKKTGQIVKPWRKLDLHHMHEKQRGKNQNMNKQLQLMLDSLLNLIVIPNTCHLNKPIPKYTFEKARKIEYNLFIEIRPDFFSIYLDSQILNLDCDLSDDDIIYCYNEYHHYKQKEIDKLLKP